MATMRIFSNEAEAEMARRYTAGDKLREIAADYQTNTTQVWTALHRQGAQQSRPAARMYRLNEKAFDNAEDSEEASYFIGLLLADGCVMVRKRQDGKKVRASVKLALSGDDGVMVERFRDFLGAEIPIRVYPCRRGVGSFSNGKPVTEFRVGSTALAKALASYGVVPRKSLVAVPSKKLANNVAFWRGVVDGDGSVWIVKNTLPCLQLVGSHETCSGFLQYVKSWRYTRATIYKAVNIWKVSFAGSTAFHVIKRLYGNCTIALPRKAEVARRILSECGRWEKDKQVVLTHDGLTLHAAEWARRLGIRPERIYKGLRSGWPVDEILTQP
jgi:hypothetical protein